MPQSVVLAFLPACGQDLQQAMKWNATRQTRKVEQEASNEIPEVTPIMLDVHPRHEPVHSWKDFFVHIITITIGLLIAVGIEQTVEFVHHRNQARQLEEQMQAVFESDLQSDEDDFERLANLRAYMVELRAAIAARLDGQTSVPQPSPNDSRTVSLIIAPSLAPYEAAKENGTVAWLPSSRIRIYNCIALTREMELAARDRQIEGLAAVDEFQERFVDSPDSLGFGKASAAPHLSALSPAALTEYQALIAALIKKTDYLSVRVRLFDRECRAILNGVRDEGELIKIITQETGSSNSTGISPRPK